jgi:predicted KAP-like P-loop ATPase
MLDSNTFDNPIKSSAEDALDRKDFAELIANALRNGDPDHGAVVGINGPWGSGKSSVANMVVEDLGDEVQVTG